MAPGRRPRSRPPPPSPPDEWRWGAPGEMPPRLPYPPHHPPMLHRAAAAAAAANHHHHLPYHNGVPNVRGLAERRGLLLGYRGLRSGSNTTATAGMEVGRPWEYAMPGVRGMPVMFEEQVDWESNYDALGGGLGISARRRMNRGRRRWRLTAWWRRRRRTGGSETAADSVEYTYEELLRLEERNVPCGLSRDELEGLTTFEVDKAGVGGVCRICLEAVEFGDVVVELDCGHIYHKACIFTWLNVKRSCPTCRCEV